MPKKPVYSQEVNGRCVWRDILRAGDHYTFSLEIMMSESIPTAPAYDKGTEALQRASREAVKASIDAGDLNSYQMYLGVVAGQSAKELAEQLGVESEPLQRAIEEALKPIMAELAAVHVRQTGFPKKSDGGDAFKALDTIRRSASEIARTGLSDILTAAHLSEVQLNSVDLSSCELVVGKILKDKVSGEALEEVKKMSAEDMINLLDKNGLIPEGDRDPSYEFPKTFSGMGKREGVSEEEMKAALTAMYLANAAWKFVQPARAESEGKMSRIDPGASNVGSFAEHMVQRMYAEGAKSSSVESQVLGLVRAIYEVAKDAGEVNKVLA